MGKFLTYDEGDNVYFRDGTRLTYSDKTRPGSSHLTRLSPRTPPRSSSRSAQWDGQTLENWAEAHSSYSANESFRRLVAVATRPIFGAEPRDLSFLFRAARSA